MNKPSQQIDMDELSGFLKEAGWGEATLTPMGADMGLRRYFDVRQKSGRVEKNALLMDMSRAGILEIGLDSYINVARYLSDIKVKTPNIYHYDLDSGLALIENLGTQSFGDVKRGGVAEGDIYSRATEILARIKAGVQGNDLGLSGYKETLIYKRLGQFVDYYMPVGANRLTTQADHDEFHAVWAEIEAALPPCPMGFCHADYHLENLMWCPETDEGYGVIDFQDAFWGFQGYDLLNLLEDARVSVPEDIKNAMKDKYRMDMGAKERQIFDDWYTVFSAQFHCRVIGLFIKFARENRGTEFLAHIPRLQGYITANLENPVLAPLKEFMTRHNISLSIKV